MPFAQALALSCALALLGVSGVASAGAPMRPGVALQPTPTQVQMQRELAQALATAARHGYRSHRASAKRTAHIKVRKPDPLDSAMRQTPARPPREPVLRRIAASSYREAEARETIERNARAEYLYRSSQLSAPIVTNATACKRIGAHGESVYENCGADAAGTGISADR